MIIMATRQVTRYSGNWLISLSLFPGKQIPLYDYGGEEFIIILPNTSEEETISLANRILHTVQENTFIVHIKERVKITLSCGTASYPRNAVDAKSLLNAADMALYEAKTTGKNVVYCYEGFNE